MRAARATTDRAADAAAAAALPTRHQAYEPVLGYVRADSRTTDRDLAQSVSDLAVFVAGAGRELSTVIVEWTDDARAAFDAAAAELTEFAEFAGLTGTAAAHPIVRSEWPAGRVPVLMACTPAGRP
ncbi:hypothetical protein [Nocardioides speluncae]|uniref:hypothetical protein n=1 Tax=Nocardioides speluncae TaxID=2670337 RepID=UPI0012B16AEF|nr:hypothetical protein [Nocardioides speluncae]